MSTFKLLRPEEVINQWSKLSSLLEKAVAEGNGELLVDDIRQLVLSGRMFLFASEEFAVTCEFVAYPRKTVMVVGFGAGKVPTRSSVGEALIAFAKSAGASSIATYCKNPAMTRYYRLWFQLEPTYTVLEKAL